MTLLTLLLVIPFVSAAAVFLIRSKALALTLSLIPLPILLYGHFQDVSYPWIPALSVNLHLGVDALTLLFLYLTAIVIPLAIYAFHGPSPQPFYSLALLLQGFLIGFFTARDLVVFTVFWEAMLLPLFLIITFWGGARKESAGLKFITYMIAGSSLMVAGVLLLYFTVDVATFDFAALAKSAGNSPYAPWIFAVFLLAFAVKTPLFPFHAWLPEAYTQAPLAGTILLSAILSKAGIYGVLRIGMEFFPVQLKEWSPLLLGLAIAGVLYGALAAWVQSDFKRLIAYSSFSHVNFILAGIFIFNDTAQTGALLQALNHGITIAALFLSVGWLEERLGSTSFEAGSGLAQYFPKLCWITFLFVLANVALPGTNNFIGEFLILFGVFDGAPWLALLLGLSVILSAVYMLRFMQNVYFSQPSLREAPWQDIGIKEFAVALPLAGLILWIGLYPAPIIERIVPAAQEVTLERS